jgi:hypothetical protein
MRNTEHHSPAPFRAPVEHHEDRRPFVELHEPMVEFHQPVVEFHEERRPIVSVVVEPRPVVVMEPERPNGKLYENVDQVMLDRLLVQLGAKGYTVNKGDQLSGALTHSKFLGHFTATYGLCVGNQLDIIAEDHKEQVWKDVDEALALLRRM